MYDKGLNIQFNHSSHWVDSVACSQALEHHPAIHPLTQLFYRRKVISFIGASMRKEFQEVGSIRYLEVRQLYEKRKKRVKRLFTWGFDSKSHSRNRWGQNYRASFEIFVPKPTMKDVMKAYDEDNEVHPLVFVKFQNAHNHLLEDYDLEEFMSIPFFGLLNEIEQQRLIDSIYEAHVQIENLMQSMTERFINGGSENQTNNNQ